MGKTFAPTDEQHAIIETATDGDDLKVVALAGTGKALREDQPVLTPEGWRPIGALAVGDEVVGRDGLTHYVSGVFPQGNRPLFEVVMSDGTAIVADAEHRWTVQHYFARNNGGEWKVLTTQEIIDLGATRKHGNGKWFLPMAEPIKLPEADLPLDPWLLGMLLGDGTLGGTTSITTTDEEAIERVRSIVEPLGVVVSQMPSDPITYKLGGQQHKLGTRGYWNPIAEALTALGLRKGRTGKRSHEKFVPDLYKFASIDQRLELLRGLMDADGFHENPNSIDYVTTSPQLAADASWLVESLGGTAKTTKKRTTHRLAYRVRLRLPFDVVPFSLRRKAEGWGKNARLVPYRAIRSITPVDEAPAVCISVTAPDCLYLTTSCVPTHNTTTMELAARNMPDRKGLYLAFNKAVQVEADKRFPKTVTAKTAHSLAYGKVGKHYRARLNGPRVPAWQLAERFAVEGFSIGPDHQIPPRAIAATAAGTVRRFTHSADTEISDKHVLRLDGLTPAAHAALADHVLPYAEAMWADLQDPDGDKARFEHDTYLKIWALSDPVLPYDYIMLDEAQDANPVLLDVLSKQDQSQRILVGDPNQSIYSWRGALNALGRWQSQSTLHLTESFRFGPEVAAEANKWLSIRELECDLRVVGRGPKARIGPIGRADAILCRTNAGAVGEALDLIDRPSERVAIVGGGKAIKDMALAAVELQAGKTTSHPELAAFENWEAVREYVRTEDGAEDLAVFVRLVEQHGPDVLIDGVDALVDEQRGRPTTTISTAHKAKGREWPSVRVGNDFFEPGLDEYGKLQRLDKSEAMLCYVTVTRAKRHLDNDSLAWIDYYLAGDASPEQQRRWIERQAAKGADDDDPAPGSVAAVKQLVRQQRAEEREYIK